MRSDESNADKSVSKLEGQLERWSAKLDELVAKASTAKHDAKAGARAQLDDLKAKLRVAREQLDIAKAAGTDKWGAFKAGVESSWKELEGAFKKLAR